MQLEADTPKSNTPRKAAFLVAVLVIGALVAVSSVSERRAPASESKLLIHKGKAVPGVLANVAQYHDPMNVVHGGDGFVRMGHWRFGNVDGNHFSFCYCGSHPSQHKTIAIFRNDGTLHPGPRTDFSLCNKASSMGGFTNGQFSGNGIEFGPWCLGLSGRAGVHEHLSITHHNGHGADKTAMIWRDDGMRHPGPRTDFSCWNPAVSYTVGVGTQSSREFIQFGTAFRMGETAVNHFSIGGRLVATIYRSDGTIHPGPRYDFGWTAFDECAPELTWF